MAAVLYYIIGARKPSDTGPTLAEQARLSYRLEELTAYLLGALPWEVSPSAIRSIAGTKSITNNMGTVGIEGSGDHTHRRGETFERKEESEIPPDIGGGRG
jgi:hypothetical protein